MTNMELELKIKELEEIIAEKDKEIERLKRRNPNNAGRKAADDKWVASFSKFTELYESQKSIYEIMEETGISRATYYRYKRLYDDTNVSLKK